MRNGLSFMIISIILCALTLNALSIISSSNPIGWSGDIRLTDASSDRGDPSIALNGDNIHVVWVDGRGEEAYDDYEIYFKKSTDNGKTWSDCKRLSNAPHYSLWPKIAVNDSDIHVIWTDDREGGVKIFYNRSEDKGESWVGEIRISPDTTKGNPDSLDVAVNGDNVHVVYSDYSEDPSEDFQLYYINSSDNGNTWSPRQRLTSLNRDSYTPSLAVNESNIHIVWMDHYDKIGNMQIGDIFYLRSTDGGISWGNEINLTPLNNNPLDSDYPHIAVYRNNIHVIYADSRDGIWQIHYRRSENNGLTWTDDVKLSNSTNDVYLSSIALDNNKVHVVWTDERDGNREIYYKYSIDNGENWSDDIRLTYDSAQSITQDIAVNNKVHVVFGDDRSGDMEIYYKHYPFYPPPINLTIDISGTNLILNWSTPLNSLSPVDHYLIYRSTTWDSYNFAFPWINTSVDDDNGIIPLRTSWNDTIAFLDESNNYYYVVRAVYENGEIDYNENIVGKNVIQLNKGWNLFSIPLAQNDTKISEILKSIGGNYNIVQWYDAKIGKWHSSLSGLTDINRTMGLWIHIKNACNLSVVGAVPGTTYIALYEGWNLVGYPSLKSRNLNDALNGINWQAIQQYNAFDANDPWKHNSTKKPDRLNDLKGMQPGCGYWVYVTINDTWVRTRTIEDKKVVVWRVGESEEKILNNQPFFKPTIENPMEMEQDNDYQVNNIFEQPTVEEKEDSYVVSIIPLIILIAFILAEIKLLHKKKK